jgi:hypothetical protein
LQHAPQTLPRVVAVAAAPGTVRVVPRPPRAEERRRGAGPAAALEPVRHRPQSPCRHPAPQPRASSTEEVVCREHRRDLLTSSAPGRALWPWGAAARAAALSRSRRPGRIPTRRYAACGVDASWACRAKLPCEGQRNWWRTAEEAATNGPLRGAPMSREHRCWRHAVQEKGLEPLHARELRRLSPNPSLATGRALHQSYLVDLRWSMGEGESRENGVRVAGLRGSSWGGGLLGSG